MFHFDNRSFLNQIKLYVIFFCLLLLNGPHFLKVTAWLHFSFVCTNLILFFLWFATMWQF